MPVETARAIIRRASGMIFAPPVPLLRSSSSALNGEQKYSASLASPLVDEDVGTVTRFAGWRRMMRDLIVGARWVVTGVKDRETPVIHEQCAVLSRDGIIVAIGPIDELRQLSPSAQERQFADHVMLPGFVNAHHHVGLTPLQLGSPDDALELWIARRMAARSIDPYLDTLYSAFEMIASGVTTVAHIHDWLGGSFATAETAATSVLEAYRTIGMRVSYSSAVRIQNHLVYEPNEAFCARLPGDLGDELRAQLKANSLPLDDYGQLFDHLLAQNQGQRLSRIQLTPANLHWVDDDALQSLHEKAQAANVPMHMHLLETAYQKAYAKRQTGNTAIRHLHDLGVLSDRLTIGHGVWLTAEDIDIVAETGTCICHNCSSNFRLRSGLAPLNAFEARGINVAIGLDEAGINDDRDMLQEMRLVLRAHRTPGMDDTVPTSPQVLRMATEGGARTTAFGSEIGRLEPGRAFDAALVNWTLTTYPFQDPDLPLLDTIIQRAKTNAIDAVLVDGTIIYEDGQFANIDRDAVLREIATHFAKPRSDDEIRRQTLAGRILPHVRSFYEGYAVAECEPFYSQSSRR